MLSLANYDRFAVYGLELGYPNDWRVEIRGKSKREKGDVIFQSPAGPRIFLSWGPLALVAARFAVLEKHADNSLANVKKMQNVKSLEIVDRRREKINGHDAVYTHAKIVLEQRMMVRKFKSGRDIQSIHLHCEVSDRYFIIYNPVDEALAATPQSDKPDVDLLALASGTFKCHGSYA
jgi:hypothetical protein